MIVLPTSGVRELLAQLDELHAAGTPGTWRYNPHKHHREPDGRYEEGVFVGALGRAATNVAVTGPSDDPQSMRDAALIAAAVNALPTLVSAVRTSLNVADKLAAMAARPTTPMPTREPLTDTFEALAEVDPNPWRNLDDDDPRKWAADIVISIQANAPSLRAWLSNEDPREEI
jgi:hypothetical protein